MDRLRHGDIGGVAIAAHMTTREAAIPQLAPEDCLSATIDRVGDTLGISVARFHIAPGLDLIPS